MPTAIGKLDLPGIGMDRSRPSAEPQLDPLLSIELERAQRYPFLGRVAGEIVLRQIGPVARRHVIIAKHRDRAGIALTPQHLRSGFPRRATADNDDGLRRGLQCRPRLAACRLDLFPDIYRPIPLLDTPAWDRVQRWRAQRLSGTKTETGVVPGTAHCVLDEDPLSEWTVVVGAFGADREQLLTTAREQHRVVRDVPQNHAALFNIRKRHPLRKVGSVELLLVAHGWLLTYGGWNISQRYCQTGFYLFPQLP